MLKDTELFSPRAVTALKPQSVVHLGNYCGSLRKSLEFQQINPRENFIFVADLHGLIEQNTRMNASKSIALVVDLLSLGFDPDKTIIYRQDDLPELNELMWFLGCYISTERVIDHSKSKKVTNPTISATLYPLLMAADVIGIRANIVAVGPDESRHVEFIRKLAKAINVSIGSPIVPIPYRSFKGEKEIVGIDGHPMSTSRGNTIPIFVEADELRVYVSKIAESRVPKQKAVDPETDTTFQILKCIADDRLVSETEKAYREKRIDSKDAKELLFGRLREEFGGMLDRRITWGSKLGEIEEILQAGALHVRNEIRELLYLLRGSR